MELYIQYQAMAAARESANWAFWTMIVSIAAATISLLTVFLAFFALRTWREEVIEASEREWKKSLVEFSMKLKNSVCEVSKDNHDRYCEFYREQLRSGIDKSIACWSSLLVALDTQPSRQRKFLEKYAKVYLEFIELFDLYEDGKSTKYQITEKISDFHVFPPDLAKYF